MPTVSFYSPTGDPYVDGILSGLKWGAGPLTFSFPTASSFYGSVYGSGEPANNFKAFTAVQQTAVRTVLQTYSAVANLTFTEVTESSSTHGDLRYAESDAPSTAWAYYPTLSSEGGDVWANNSRHLYDNPVKGNYAWLTMIHETGHTEGLKHPQDVSGSFGAMPLDHDSLEYSVMAYRSFVGAGLSGYTNASDSYPQTLMMYDIVALQTLYGANYTSNSGNTVYTWNPTTGQEFVNGVGQGAPVGNKIFMTVWDGGGNDTYDFSNYTTNLSVDLQPGHWTTASAVQLANLGAGHIAAGNIANALLFNNNAASLIDNAVGGSGNDSIIGNTASNALNGGGGDDSLKGGGGNDSLDGGTGINTAVYSGISSSYSWLRNADGTWTVTDLGSGTSEGVDTVTNIKFLKFSNTTVAIGNHPPVATADSYNTLHDHLLIADASTGVLANDTDPSPTDILTASLSADALNGHVVLNPDGSFSYTPNARYHGVDGFSYLASDGVDQTLGFVTVNVTDNAPVATADSYNLFHDHQLIADASTGVLANDTDADPADTLTASLSADALNGHVVLNPDGSFSYTPNAGYRGPDSFNYLASDGAIKTAGSVAINVASDVPAATADSYNTLHDHLLIADASTGVLANDTDADPTDTLTASLNTDASNGHVVLNPDGSFSYTPNAGYHGVDGFNYVASDGVDQTLGFATVNVTDNAPVAIADSYNTLRDNQLIADASTGVLANDTDADPTDALTALLNKDASNGHVVLNPDGSFSYTPNAGYHGPDSFNYLASDGAIQTLGFAVINVADHPPVAAADSYNTLHDHQLVVDASTGVLANDTDAGPTDILTASLSADALNGHVVLNPDGSFSYTPNAGYHGVDGFNYLASDGVDQTLESVTINVTDHAPAATADSYNTLHDHQLIADASNGVLANDTDADPTDTLTASLSADALNGDVALNSDGSFSYTPNAGYHGVDGFSYLASDGAIQTLGFAVINVTDNAPVATADSYVAFHGNQLAVDASTGVLANDTDADSTDTLTASLSTDASNGHVVVNPDGSFSYTPDPQYTGPDGFSYLASDGSIETLGFVLIGVIHHPPITVADSYNTLHDHLLVADASTGVLANDTDANPADTPTVSLSADALNGHVVLNPDGSFSYAPNAGYRGVDGFTYLATDGIHQTFGFATITVTDNAPVATDSGPYAVDEDTPLTISAANGVLNGATDADNDPMTAVLASGPTHAQAGSFVLNPDGSFSYQGALDFYGQDSFSYYAFDGLVASNSVTVLIDVAPVNDAPVANPDLYSVALGQTLHAAAPGVLGNDTDVDNGSLSALLQSGTNDGLLTFNSDGSFDYKPFFKGQATLTYQASDGASTSGPASDITDPFDHQPLALGPAALAHQASDGASTGGLASVTIDIGTDASTFDFSQSSVNTTKQATGGINNILGGSGNDTIVGNNNGDILNGGGGNDVILGGSGADVLIGGAGNDRLSGRAGDDVFVFRPGFGHDTAIDFSIGDAAHHDTLDFRGLGFASLAEVLSHTDLGPNAVIHAGADAVTLLGVTQAALSAHSFDLLVQ